MEIKNFTIVTTMLAFAIGILFTAQWKTPPARISNPIISYVALKDTANDLINKQLDYKTQITQLQKDNKALQQRLKSYTGTSKQEVEELEQLKLAVGLTEIRDKGIIITLNDSEKQEANSNSIAHAADMRDLVNVLWLNGASAISINGQRLTGASSIDCIVNTVLINETRTTTPFVITVVGPQNNLYDKLTDKKVLAGVYYRVEKEGLIFKVDRSSDVFIPAYNGSFNIKYAQVKQ